MWNKRPTAEAAGDSLGNSLLLRGVFISSLFIWPTTRPRVALMICFIVVVVLFYCLSILCESNLHIKLASQWVSQPVGVSCRRIVNGQTNDTQRTWFRWTFKSKIRKFPLIHCCGEGRKNAGSLVLLCNSRSIIIIVEQIPETIFESPLRTRKRIKLIIPAKWGQWASFGSWNM